LPLALVTIGSFIGFLTITHHNVALALITILSKDDVFAFTFAFAIKIDIFA
jgi:hypothetical protein